MIEESVLNAWRALQGLVVVPKTPDIDVVGTSRSAELTCELNSSIEIRGAGHEGLHPDEQRQLVRSLQTEARWAEPDPILLFTASPVVLDAVERDQIYLIGPDLRPRPLHEPFEPAWLAAFAVGELYVHGELELR